MPMILEKSSPLLRRLVVAAGFAVCFLVMASVFAPDRSKAGDVDPLAGIPPRSVEYPSADPHEGLRSLGSIEDKGYRIDIYATEGGPRYTIYEQASGRELGALLSVEQVNRGFPDLHLPTMDFDGTSPLMLVGPDDVD